MSAIRILLGIVWLAVVGSSWGASGRAIRAEKNTGNVAWMPGTSSNGARRVIEIARKEIGVKEDSPNSSQEIDAYNAYVGYKAVPWCASFVSWCHAQAGFAEPRTAWSPALFPRDRLTRNPLTGMVIGIYFNHLKRVAHCGIVEWSRNGWVGSIEGNTNLNGSREGDGVYRRVRHIRTIKYLADWTKKGGDR